MNEGWIKQRSKMRKTRKKCENKLALYELMIMASNIIAIIIVIVTVFVAILKYQNGNLSDTKTILLCIFSVIFAKLVEISIRSVFTKKADRQRKVVQALYRYYRRCLDDSKWRKKYEKEV